VKYTGTSTLTSGATSSLDPVALLFFPLRMPRAVSYLMSSEFSDTRLTPLAFDFTAGDVGYIPITNSHYIENTGTVDLIVLEVLQAPKFTDISVAQWLALTPTQVVVDTLHLPLSVIQNLPKEKTYLKPGNTNLTALAGNGTAY
jgi:hypothetical protein